MKRVKVLDKLFELHISSEQITQRVIEIASEIVKDMEGKDPLMVCILNGSFMFAADLMKHMEIPCQISFVKLSSYEGMGSTGIVTHLIGLKENIKGRSLILLEDIVDSGITILNARNQLLEMEPESVKIASLLYKPKATQIDLKIDYVGFEIENDFVVGYGLDYEGYGRNLKDIYKLVK